MKKPQSFFKMSLKQEDNKPSITEVTYKGADGNTYNWLQFEWYASTKDLDRGRDVIMPEAFRNSIEQFMENPIIFLQHDSNKAIGTIIEATIDDVWLYVKGIVKTDKDNIFQDLRTGVIKTMSFGYRITEYETIDTPDWVYRQINWLELFEVSLVSVPMNPKAKIKSKKELLEKWLNDEEYAKNFQISKNDEYTLYKSIEDLRIKSEDLVEKEEVVEEKEKIIEEKEEIKEEITEVEEENTDTEEKEEEKPVETDTEVKNKEVEEESVDNVSEEEKTDEIETENKENKEIEKKELISNTSLQAQITDKLKEELWIEDWSNERVRVLEIFVNEFVFNHYLYAEEWWFDKYYRRWYKIEDWDVMLEWENVEVESQTQWIDKTKEFKLELEKSLEIEKKELISNTWLEAQITDKLKEELWIEDWSNERVRVLEIFVNEFVFNHYLYAEEWWFDKYYRRWYKIEDWDVMLEWENVEVESQTQWIDKTKEFKLELEKSLEIEDKEVEEEKETIEEPEIPENVVWDSDKSEVEDTETPENEVEEEINEDLEKRFNQIEKTLETIEETKGLSIETKSQIELLQKDLSDLKSDTKKFKEDMSVVVEWCLSKVKELYTAFKNHYIDSALPYVEEKKPEEDVMLATWLAKTIAKIKS